MGAEQGHQWEEVSPGPRQLENQHGGPADMVPGEPDPPALVRHLGQVLVRLPHGGDREEPQGSQGTLGQHRFRR